MTQAIIEIFTSVTCPHCPRALKQVKDIEAKRDDIIVVNNIINTAEGSARAKEFGVLAVPCIFLQGSTGEVIGFKEFPTKDELNKAIDAANGKIKLEKKSLFKRLFKDQEH